jgi:hypothetical protein
MTAMILPGTYIEVRAEGLIAPGQVTVGNVGVVGTAAKGPIVEEGTEVKPTLLSNYNDALAIFGPYDAFSNPTTAGNSLTLVRALELVFANGGSTVYAVRVAGSSAKAATHTILSDTPNKKAATLTARSKGAWGNDLTVNVEAAETDPVIQLKKVSGPLVKLAHAPIVNNPRNRITVKFALTGITTDFKILYDSATPLSAGEVNIKTSDGTLTFGGTAPGASDEINATYVVSKTTAAKVTLQLGAASEVYTVVDDQNLVDSINSGAAPSALVTATVGELPNVLPAKTPNIFARFSGGDNGASGAPYTTGIKALLDVDAHIIVAAGQDDRVGSDLDAHCQTASTDVFKRDRIAVVGSAAAGTDVHGYVDKLVSNKLASDRVIFVAPGFVTTSSAKGDEDANPIKLPGAYTAAVIAGKLAALPPHVSLTNKSVAVQDVEVKFSDPQLTELVQNRVTALEVSRGIRVLRGQTTDDGAFREITTRRIVDFAKFGVRAAAGPYIGLLNNERVRSALRTTINSFLQGMLDDEMLVAYKLEVSATRDEQIKGIVQVALSLQPVFSINFIRVTMILS